MLTFASMFRKMGMRVLKIDTSSIETGISRGGKTIFSFYGTWRFNVQLTRGEISTKDFRFMRVEIYEYLVY